MAFTLGSLWVAGRCSISSRGPQGPAGVASRGPQGPAGDVFMSIHLLSRSQGPAGDASRGPQGPAGDVFISILHHFSSSLHLHPSLRKPFKGL